MENTLSEIIKSQIPDKHDLYLFVNNLLTKNNISGYQCYIGKYKIVNFIEQYDNLLSSEISEENKELYNFLVDLIEESDADFDIGVDSIGGTISLNFTLTVDQITTYFESNHSPDKILFHEEQYVYDINVSDEFDYFDNGPKPTPKTIIITLKTDKTVITIDNCWDPYFHIDKRFYHDFYKMIELIYKLYLKPI